MRMIEIRNGEATQHEWDCPKCGALVSGSVPSITPWSTKDVELADDGVTQLELEDEEDYLCWKCIPLIGTDD